MRERPRVSWSVSKRTVSILSELIKEYKKLHGIEISHGRLIDEIVYKVSNPIERRREEMKELQKRLMQLKDEIEQLGGK